MIEETLLETETSGIHFTITVFNHINTIISTYTTQNNTTTASSIGTPSSR